MNTFEFAVKNGEMSSFFRGEGKYFIRCPDWGIHLHGANLSGAIESYIKENNYGNQVLESGFLIFLKSLKVDKEDFEHLLANLAAYFAIKNDKSGLSGVNFFRSSESVQILKSYLKEVRKSGLYASVQPEMKAYIDYMVENGSNLVRDVLDSDY
ncbi:hypothetical protein [Aliikangiella maris]|uniref:Uncharacterized protein n=2 Tax=Aliikangiella maris TaxID=3162458 RepID=A0ABV3MVI2_9GAMM